MAGPLLAGSTRGGGGGGMYGSALRDQYSHSSCIGDR